MAKYINPYTDDYERSRLNYIAFKQATDTAKRDGREEGKEEGKIEVAISMKKDGFSHQIIAKYTGLSETEIEKL